MIPKVIHYCWFGGNPLSELAQKCIASWKKYCPDYEIKEWNESNFDLSCCDYVREAYEAKKWAFVSDYARLDIIYQNGGIYLDTDVELIKPLDVFLKLPAFLGVEATGSVATGLGFGAEKGNVVIADMLAEYNGCHFKLEDGTYDTTPCPIRNTNALEKRGYTIAVKEIWETDDVTIFPVEYFCPIDYKTGVMKIQDKTYSIHHYSASWYTDENRYQSNLTKKMAKSCPTISYRWISLLARFITIAKFRGINSAIKKVREWHKAT